MKKIRVGLLAALLLVMSSTSIRPANAITGIVFGNVPLIVVGALVTTFSVIPLIVYSSTYHERGRLGGIIASAIFTGIGIIMLDETGKFEFSPINDKQAAQMKISKADAAVYNSEVAELNSVNEMVQQEVQVATEAQNPTQNPTQKPDVKQSTEQAKTAWKKYSGYVSEQTMAVAQKIAQSTFERIQHAR
jgi:hypothetical protein